MDELAKIGADRDKADAEYMGMAELQKLRDEMKLWKKEIEEKHVKL